MEAITYTITYSSDLNQLMQDPCKDRVLVRNRVAKSLQLQVSTRWHEAFVRTVEYALPCQAAGEFTSMIV